MLTSTALLSRPDTGDTTSPAEPQPAADTPGVDLAEALAAGLDVDSIDDVPDETLRHVLDVVSKGLVLHHEHIGDQIPMQWLLLGGMTKTTLPAKIATDTPTATFKFVRGMAARFEAFHSVFGSLEACANLTLPDPKRLTNQISGTGPWSVCPDEPIVSKLIPKTSEMLRSDFVYGDQWVCLDRMSPAVKKLNRWFGDHSFAAVGRDGFNNRLYPIDMIAGTIGASHIPR